MHSVVIADMTPRDFNLVVCIKTRCNSLYTVNKSRPSFFCEEGCRLASVRSCTDALQRQKPEDSKKENVW